MNRIARPKCERGMCRIPTELIKSYSIPNITVRFDRVARNDCFVVDGRIVKH